MQTQKSHEIILAEIPVSQLYALTEDTDIKTGEKLSYLDSMRQLTQTLGGRAVLSMNGKQTMEAHRFNRDREDRPNEQIITIVGQFPMTPGGLSAVRAIELHDALTEAPVRTFVPPPEPTSPAEALYQAYLES